MPPTPLRGTSRPEVCRPWLGVQIHTLPGLAVTAWRLAPPSWCGPPRRCILGTTGCASQDTPTRSPPFPGCGPGKPSASGLRSSSAVGGDSERWR